MSFFFFTLSAPQIFFKDEKDKSLSIEFKLYWTQDILLHALEEWEEADCTATHIFLFLESLLLRNWVWLCASVLADMSNLFVCILACASSCPLMHCIYCFACDMSVVPSVLLKDDAPFWDANSTPVAPRHPELCHSSKPRCHWRTANATGMSAGSQRCNPVGAYVCGFTLKRRLSLNHTHLPLFTLHSNPQLDSQSETFRQKWPRST